MLSREQIYLKLLFSKLSPSPVQIATVASTVVVTMEAIGPVSDKEGVHTLKASGESSLILNNSPTAGSTLGFKHKS